MQRELDIPNNTGLLEVEDTLKRLQSHKGVEGVLIITKSGAVLHSTLDPNVSIELSSTITRITQQASTLVSMLNAEQEDDHMTFIRIHSKNNKEIMISPGSKSQEFFLIVVQSASST